MIKLIDRALNGKADKLAARFQEIEPRWKKRKRGRKHFSLERQRFRDLRIILGNRYPDGIPSPINIDELVKMKAQILGDSLGLTGEERKMWKIKTIRPCDRTIEDMRRERDRKGARARRKANGRVSRKEYLAAKTISRLKPWEAEGISRRTWYYRRAQVRRVAQVRRDYFTSKSDDAPVQKIQVDAFPFTSTIGYLMLAHEYRKLTSGGIRKAVPGQAARSELRRGA